MNFYELLKSRYSVRAYTRDPVPDESLQRVLEAARIAPTAANRQAFQVIVIHSAGRERDLLRIYGREWFAHAPVVLAVCALPKQNWIRRDGKNYSDVDAAIVMDHMILAATAAGLGTCWIGAFDPDAARQVLDLPSEVEPVVFTPLGFPADEAGAKKRKDLSELVRYERW